MRRDPTQFRERFKRWKEGKDVYEAGLPKYDDGTEPNLYRRPNGEYFYTDGNYETPVTPFNKLGDDPSMWTYRDASGKIYQPRVGAANTEVVSQDNNVWTKQRVEETNRRTWLSDAADIAHGAGEGALLFSNFVNPEASLILLKGVNFTTKSLGKLVKSITKPGKNMASSVEIKPFEFKQLLALPVYTEEVPEKVYKGKIPKRIVDYDKIRSFLYAQKTMSDIAADPTNYTMQEISDAVKQMDEMSSLNGTLPIKIKSSEKIFEHGGQSFRDHLKYNINPVLRHDGFKGVPLDSSPEEALQYVKDKYRELNTFARGVVDPRDFHQYGLYDTVRDKLYNQLGRFPNDDEIMDYMAVTPNRGITGHGAAGRKHGEYVLYTSNGYNQAAGYALRGDHPYNVNPLRRAVYELELPELIPDEHTTDSRFSPIANYILNNRFALSTRGNRGLKDLYSEYGLPYQLATGRSLSSALPAKVLYDESLLEYLNALGSITFGHIDPKKGVWNPSKLNYINPKEFIANDVIKDNNNVELINSTLGLAGTDITVPYVSIKTALNHPDKYIKRQRLINLIKPLSLKYNEALSEWPDHMHQLLNEEYIKDVKKVLHDFKEIEVPKMRTVLKYPTEDEVVQQVKKDVGDIPFGGFLKHKHAHNVFTTEGKNKRLTVNDKRWHVLTGTRDPDATLQHYVWYDESETPILKIKRKVPFDEWSKLRNHGSDHYGSYSPGLSRRMSSYLPPLILGNVAYGLYNENK